MWQLIFVFLLLPSHTFAVEHVDLNLNTDKSGWVDLLDPLSSGGFYESNFERNQQCASEELIQQYKKQIDQLIAANELLKNQKSESVDVLLKHILRQFFMQLNVELTDGYEVERYARVYLSSSHVTVLLEYLNSKRHSEEVALREKLRYALEDFIVAESQSDESGLILMIRKFLPYIFILNVIFLPFAIYNVLRRLIGPRQFLGFCLIGTFSLSYYFTYIRKYQEVLADRFLRVNNSNDACSPKGLISEAFSVLLSYVRIKGKDQCLQKYEDMLVEPFLLVDPLQVFGEVLTNFLMSPFSVVGIHLNKFFNDFFIDTPIFLSAIKLVFIILVLFYLSGYRIRTILGTIEPAENLNRVRAFEMRQVATSLEERSHNFDMITANDRKQQAALVYDGAIVEELQDSDLTVRQSVQAKPSSSIPQAQLLKSTHDQADSFEFPMIANLDDSNVTRRRNNIQRSKSLPRFFQGLSLE